VAIKSGWNFAGIQFGIPSKSILVRNATSGCRGGFTIGSEIGGGVENITFRDSHSTGQCGFRISSELGRGGYVRDVRYENIELSWDDVTPPPQSNLGTNPHAPFLFLVNQEYRPDNPNKTLSYFSNILFVNITAKAKGATQMGDITCRAASPCHEINIDALHLSGFGHSSLSCKNAFGIMRGMSGGTCTACIKPEHSQLAVHGELVGY